MKNNIAECLKDLSKIPVILEKLEPTQKVRFFEMLLEKATEILGDVPRKSLEDLDDDTLKEFLTVQAKDIKELTEEDLALLIQTKISLNEQKNEKETPKEDSSKAPKEKVTLGSLYNLSEDDPDFLTESKLSTATRDKLPGKAFCGPERSFPVHDKAHAVAAMRLLGRYKGPGDKKTIEACIKRKAAKFGVGTKEETLILAPVIIEVNEIPQLYVCPITKTDQIAELVEELDSIAETYGVSELKDSINTYLEESKEILTILETEETLANLFSKDYSSESVILNENFLIDYFDRMENLDGELRSFILPLVAVVRKLNLDKNTIQKHSEAYACFSTSTLLKLYNNTPSSIINEDKPIEDTSSSEIEEASSIDTVSNPITEVAKPVISKKSDLKALQNLSRSPRQYKK